MQIKKLKDREGSYLCEEKVGNLWEQKVYWGREGEDPHLGHTKEQAIARRCKDYCSVKQFCNQAKQEGYV